MDELLDTWMDLGPTVAPSRIAEATRDEIRITHQRRVTWWPARRFPIMNNTKVRFGLAAAAVIVIALLGIRFLPNNVAGPGVTPTREPTPTPIPALNGQAPLPPGRYQVDPAALPMDVSVEVPAGWAAGDTWILVGPPGPQEPDGMAIRFYTVSNVFKNPSSYADGVLVPPVGPTADDLVNAIADQTGWMSSTPSEVSIGGYPAQHVQIRIPEDAEFDRRGGEGDGHFYLFAVEGSGEIWGWVPRQTFEIYAVDVDGERLVIEAFHYPDTSDSDLAAQQTVLDSIEISPER